jgi:hypothetical protein
VVAHALLTLSNGRCQAARLLISPALRCLARLPPWDHAQSYRVAWIAQQPLSMRAALRSCRSRQFAEQANWSGRLGTFKQELSRADHSL